MIPVSRGTDHPPPIKYSEISNDIVGFRITRTEGQHKKGTGYAKGCKRFLFKKMFLFDKRVDISRKKQTHPDR
jgi:hypothetical protein